MKQLKIQAKRSYHDHLKQKSHFRSFTLQSEQDSILEKLNTSTVKIFNEIQQVKSKVVEMDSDFQIRQKSYELEKQKKILQMKEEQLKNEQIQSKGKPKINKTQQIQEMINNYMEASKNSKFGDLLLNKEKSMQKESTSIMGQDNSSNYENNDPARIATQTLESTKMYNEQSVTRKSNSYIPIHERVKFIVQTKNDKIQEQKQQQQQEVEEYYSSLPFQPLSTKSQNIKFTPQYTDEFVNNQLKWNQQRDKWIYEQQLKKENDTPKYSYRPMISPWPVKQSSVQRKHSKSINLSFFLSTANKTEASPKKNESFVFQTDLRIAKRKEKESKKLQK
ncbi:unnamed protein product (macronuclear) [Paramecium tetraurelia]|uniref:Uncharacterized protein n=1 Tax=Paramecium tetraurelia TaxID=5888 RepID=A0CTQ1_PARTE|nr:uncharacterized protein GSPATT00010402001 [Paramecium tetraurelia]CAK74168.1 unnamed protein product [Paramecium tetraurelia]|eukprot:XP_001441565.1 hypothetical protein (macronuclear) [Paramecium tetraurelia strain d4-2]